MLERMAPCHLSLEIPYLMQHTVHFRTVDTTQLKYGVHVCVCVCVCVCVIIISLVNVFSGSILKMSQTVKK